MAIQIDGVPFYEFGGKKKEFSSPGSWNGNQLKNTLRTNWFLLPLASGSHSITFVADGAPFVEYISLFNTGDLKAGIVFDPTLLPITQSKRLFFDLIIKNINLQSAAISASAINHDLQCFIDGKAEENQTSKHYRKFFWRNSEKSLNKTFTTDTQTHTLAFIGRGSPVLKQINPKTSGYTLVQHGRIAMYQEIDPYPRAQLRKEATRISDSLGELNNGEELDVPETRVVGQMQAGKSNIWHRVKSRLGEGYVLSSFVEIEGQERGIIVQKIDSLYPIPLWEKDIPGIYQYPLFGDRVFEAPSDTFYFTLGSRVYCGASSCVWSLFRFKRGDGLPTLAVRDIQDIDKFILSPDSIHLAYSHAGYLIGDSLFILNTKTLSERKIDFNVGKSACARVESLSWKNSTELEIESTDSYCVYEH